jgi:predicted NBD/HSP70 family sugar kinase
MTYVLFDIGGTKTRIALSDDLETYGESMSFKTPKKFQAGMKEFEQAVAKILPDGVKVKGLAGGIRGRLSEDKSGIDNDAVLTDWRGQSVTGYLEGVYGCPAFLENDAAIAGLGEAVFGAGKGFEIVAYHTISTGVGGAKIENGEIDLATVGFEPGHQILDVDRTVLGDEVVPTLENLVSGTAIEERYKVKAYEIPQSDVLWKELAGYVAQGLRNTVMYWSPEAIVLGGSMVIGDPCIKIDDIRKETVAALDGFVDTPYIAEAKLGDETGLYGAMAILKKRL